MEDQSAELIQGYRLSQGIYRCLHCQEAYEDGLIYPRDDLFETAEHRMQGHIKAVHGNPLQPLLQLPRKQTGLSDTQVAVFKLFALGLTDKEVAEQMKVLPATVRHHRFKLREKCRQGVVLQAMMALLENEKGLFRLNEPDQRFEISERFREETLKNHLDSQGRARVIPSKEKKKIVLLQEMMKYFVANRNYTEQEVNQVVAKMFDDYASVRRYLIEYGFLGRTNDGQTYWVI